MSETAVLQENVESDVKKPESRIVTPIDVIPFIYLRSSRPARKPLKIVTMPDSTLKAPSRQSITIDDATVDKIRHMVETMVAKKGIGIAASQVGWDARVCVIRPIAGLDVDTNPVFVPDSKDEGTAVAVLINPEIHPEHLGRLILNKTEEVKKDWEGCLSVPFTRRKISRFNKIRVNYTDLAGNKQDVLFKDWQARIVQHELDHIRGIVLGGVK